MNGHLREAKHSSPKARTQSTGRDDSRSLLPDPSIVDFHSKSSKAPMVSHFFMETGFCFFRRSCKALEGMPNPIRPI